ncbi:hypothetical protein AB6A40_006169 [Gnathostoma spinigerum]|uniref:Myosin motor domain-containing protein n=1 Tax=Gnathostoma spinigerum TaxID=75299 RepID=A0ABD6EHK0_9BILA
MRVLLFREAEIWSIFKVIASLIHIGNISFEATIVDDVEITVINSMDEVAIFAKLLQLDEQQLIRALTYRTVMVNTESVTTRRSPEQCLDVRDLLAKTIYAKLFEYVVDKINDSLYKPRKEGYTRQSIGLLDVFGFESFATNSFEQFCINFANEKLEQFFVDHLFKREQSIYETEGIEWKPIEYNENRQLLEILAYGPMNIISVIDEESISSKGTDQSVLQRLHGYHSRASKFYLKPKSDLRKSFSVVHTFGTVSYDTKGILGKNRDNFSNSLRELMASSDFKFVAKLFESEFIDDDPLFVQRKRATIGNQFKKSLDSLIERLEKRDPMFIRCIKPSETKQPMTFDSDVVCRQLRCFGLLETVRIRKFGYPVRYELDIFNDRYRILLRNYVPDETVTANEVARFICQSVLGMDGNYQLNNSKVFLKEKHSLILEQERDLMLTHRALTIQKTVRGWMQRRRFVKMSAASVLIQKHWRGYIQRKRYEQMINGFTRLQAILRTRQLVLHYQVLRNIITFFQARCRGAIIRSELRMKRLNGERRPAMMINPRETDRCSTPTSVSSSLLGSEDARLVEQIFGFLPSDNTSRCSSHASRDKVSKLIQSERGSSLTSVCDTPPPPDLFAREDLSEFQFEKFAATYFEQQTDAEYSRKKLRTPLLPHKSSTDRMVSVFESCGTK